MALSSGSRLGPYEILEQIGAGGREVPIMVLPASFSADTDRLHHVVISI